MRAIEWRLLDHAAERPVDVGDVVSVEAGGMPVYRVLALDGRQVLLGDERRPSAQVAPLERFRWKGGPAA